MGPQPMSAGASCRPHAPAWPQPEITRIYRKRKIRSLQLLHDAFPPFFHFPFLSGASHSFEPHGQVLRLLRSPRQPFVGPTPGAIGAGTFIVPAGIRNHGCRCRKPAQLLPSVHILHRRKAEPLRLAGGRGPRSSGSGSRSASRSYYPRLASVRLGDEIPIHGDVSPCKVVIGRRTDRLDQTPGGKGRI